MHEAAANLKVLTYNVKLFPALLTVGPPEERRCERIARAVLDGGYDVVCFQELFNEAAGGSCVRKSVNFLLAGDATAAGTKDWTPGVDTSASLYPGSPTMATYEAKIDGSRLPMSDAYGHGTHVAAVAAGRDFKQTLDTTGIAPGASLFDIAVLDHKGFGQLSDVLAGIDRVI